MAESHLNSPKHQPELVVIGPNQSIEVSAPSDSSEDVLDQPAPSTDDSPTIISKTVPGAANEDDGIRGRRLAHFELIEQIGQGGMAAVLRARDTQLDRFVALKILPPDLANDPENIRRFHHEARSAAKLDHENISRVFYYGEDQHLHFIAFEFVEGDNLRVVLDREGPLEVRRALGYMIQLAAGLAHASGRGVVHRDIKPSNIIITPTGRAKLVDMGLARNLEAKRGSGSLDDLTQSGVTLGTFDYIPPEQALEPRQADVRSDIYSLGCTFYHMLTGRTPFPEGTAARKLHDHQHVKPTDPRELCHGLPDDVAVILNRMMAKAPRDRYQTAEALLSDLLTVAEKLGGRNGIPSPGEGALIVETPVASSWNARQGPMILAMAVIAVVALVLSWQAPSSVPTTLATPRIGNSSDSQGGRPPSMDLAKGMILPVDPKTSGDGVASTETPRVSPDPPELSARFDPEETSESLVEWLGQHQDVSRVEILLGDDLDIKLNPSTNETGLLVKAKNQIVFKAKHPSRRPTIRLKYEARPLQTPVAALTLDSPVVRIEGIRFLVDAGNSRAELIGLRLRGLDHRVHQCDFYQALPGTDGRMTSLLIECPDNPSITPKVEIDETCWLGYRDLRKAGDYASTLKLVGLTPGGQTAVACTGKANVTIIQSAFGPHQTVFRVSRQGQQKIEMDHCSVLAYGPSSIFALEAGVQASLSVRHSLFSGKENDEVGTGNRETPNDVLAAALGSSLTEQDEAPPAFVNFRAEGPVLIREESLECKGTYTGLNNAYHHFSALWVRPDDSIPPGDSVVVEMDQRSISLIASELGQDDSHVLAGSPWQDEPFEVLNELDLDTVAGSETVRLELEQRLVRAFRVDLNSPELRQSGSAMEHLLGMEFRKSHSYIAQLPPLPLVGHQKIVDPTAPNSGRNVYPTLESAIAGSEPGDVILLRVDGYLKLPPIRIRRAGHDLTIKPDVGRHPILVLDSPEAQNEAFFRLRSGKLRLENLHIVLSPLDERLKSLTVVALEGGEGCTFHGCLLTMQPGTGQTILSAATAFQPKGVMMSSAPVGSPSQVLFDRSFIRGEGTLIHVSNPTALKVKVESSLVVTTKSLVLADNRKMSNPLPPDNTDRIPLEAGPITLTLTRSSTWLGGHFLHWYLDKEETSLNPVHIDASDCVLLGARSAGSFFRVEGPPIPTTVIKEQVTWTPRRNAYGGWTTLFDSMGATVEMPANEQQWKDFTGETMSKHRVQLEADPPVDLSFDRMRPSLFKPKGLPTTFGVDLDQLNIHLPRFDLPSEE